METMFRPFTAVANIVETAGYEISYLYEDIVFVSHNAFILLYDDDADNSLKLFFNIDCEKKQRPEILRNMSIASKSKDFKIIDAGTYALKEKSESEELEIIFFPTLSSK